jgi:hypothetical protein
MLGKVEKMMPLVRAIDFTKIPDKLLPWPNFFQNAPKNHPLPNLVGKIGNLMPPDKATNFPKIHVKVFPLASLSHKMAPRPPLVKPCWEKLENDAPWQGQQFYKDS